MQLALALSVLAHLIALFADQVELPHPVPSDLARLEANLIRTTPERRSTATSAAKPTKPAPKTTPEQAPEAARVETETPPTIETPERVPEPEVATPEPPAPEVLPAPAAEKTAGHSWPTAGLIRYRLFGGDNRDPATASNGELQWEIAPDGAYRLRLESKDAKPFPAMPWFTLSMLYSSQGKMIDGAFRPDRYEEAISVFRRMEVKFDWENNKVDFAGHNLPLKPGTLDYLSVIMQAGDQGFVERGVMLVATGRGLREYRFESGPEEDLALPFGMTWKTRQLFGKSAKNDVRVWVATEKFNLPVQIRFVIKDVHYTLIATEVLVSRDAIPVPVVEARPTPLQPERPN